MSINLLPWRNVQYRKKLFYFNVRVVIFSSICVFIIWGHFVIYQNTSSTISKSQQKIVQLQLLIDDTKQDISHHRRKAQEKLQLERIKSKLTTSILSMLSKIPFKQGELHQLRLISNKLYLKGVAKSQEEFDLLEGFFKESPHIKTIELIKFSVKNDELQFEFNLIFKEII